MEKPNNELRNFKYIELKNGVKCVLIQDELLDKSYVISSINVGSLANKQYYDGMAHLLEHMCFITSHKYKETNYLQKKVNEFGGFTNAYTDSEQTVYYLNVFHKHLENIIDIFIDFLYNAELNEEYVFNEINNVDSEHKKNIVDDSWRLSNLTHFVSDINSNYNGFFTGNNETLKKKDIVSKMKDFYAKFYLPNNIVIGIVSNKDISELEDIVNNKFGQVHTNVKPTKITYDKPFYKSNKAYQMIPNSDIHMLNYYFETDDYYNFIYNKIYNVYAFILNSNDENSLADYLIENGYIDTMYAHYQSDGILHISLTLTEYGTNNIDKIDGYLRYTMDYLNKQDWIQIMKYHKKLFEFNFNYSDKKDTLDLGIELTNNVNLYDINKIYSGNYLIHTIEKEYNIKFNNCLQILVLKSNKTDTLIDHYYGTQYFEIPFIKSKSISFNYKLDLDNQYLDIKPKFIPNLNNEISKVKKNIWFGNTSKFNEYSVYSNIIFTNSFYYKTILHTILTFLCVDIYNHYVSKYYNKAIEVGYGIGLISNQLLNNITLKIDIYNNNVETFINDLLKYYPNHISNKIIDSKLSSLKKRIKNIASLTPYDFTQYLNTKIYDYKSLCKYIDILDKQPNKYDLVKEYLSKLFNISNTNCTIFVFGNVKDVPNISKLCKYTKNTSHDFYDYKFTNYNLTHPNKLEKNNCLEIKYLIGKFEPVKILHLLYLSSILSNHFYDELRTKQQLGYVVTLGYARRIDEYYIYELIQSEKNINILENSIDNYNNKVNDYLKNINLNDWTETVTNILTEKENNLYELYSKYLHEITYRNYLFDRNKILLNHIDKISINSLMDFWDKYVLNNKKIVSIKLKKNAS